MRESAEERLLATGRSRTTTGGFVDERTDRCSAKCAATVEHQNDLPTQLQNILYIAIQGRGQRSSKMFRFDKEAPVEIIESTMSCAINIYVQSGHYFETGACILECTV